MLSTRTIKHNSCDRVIFFGVYSTNVFVTHEQERVFTTPPPRNFKVVLQLRFLLCIKELFFLLCSLKLHTLRLPSTRHSGRLC